MPPQYFSLLDRFETITFLHWSFPHTILANSAHFAFLAFLNWQHEKYGRIPIVSNQIAQQQQQQQNEKQDRYTFCARFISLSLNIHLICIIILFCVFFCFSLVVVQRVYNFLFPWNFFALISISIIIKYVTVIYDLVVLSVTLWRDTQIERVREHRARIRARQRRERGSRRG